MNLSKAWNWSKNTDDFWLQPCIEIAYLAERWRSLHFENLLDLGCGLGRHSVYMAQRGFSVTAVDLSAYAVEYTAAWAEKEGAAVCAVKSDMFSLPIPDESMDSVLAYNVIYHTDTKGFFAAMKEIRRILKKDGELFLTLISKNTYGFARADPSRLVDRNTLLLDERETGEAIPHFHAGESDIKPLLADGWTFVRMPRETCDFYDMDKPEYFSKHWQLLLRKS